MIRVLALTRYSRSAASSRQRFLVFLEHLRANGIAVTVNPFFEEEYISHLNSGNRLDVVHLVGDYIRRLRVMTSLQDFDLVWIEKEAIPYIPAGIEEHLLRHVRILLDLDDAWHLRYDKGGPTGWLLRNKISRIAKRANVLAVANDGLECWSREMGVNPSRMSLLPTGLDVSHYTVRPEPAGPFTLGWIGGPFTAPYLGEIAQPLRRLTDAGVRLIVIGETNPIPAIAGIRLEQHRWSEATEDELLGQIHVGLNPLPDDEWCRFKSGYKLIQYMAAGRAAVASPVGANNWVQSDDETGLFASGDDQWYDAILRLRSDPVLRQRLAANGRRRAEDVFSIQALGDKLVVLIKAAAAAPRR